MEIAAFRLLYDNIHDFKTTAMYVDSEIRRLGVRDEGDDAVQGMGGRTHREMWESMKAVSHFNLGTALELMLKLLLFLNNMEVEDAHQHGHVPVSVYWIMRRRAGAKIPGEAPPETRNGLRPAGISHKHGEHSRGNTDGRAAHAKTTTPARPATPANALECHRDHRPPGRLRGRIGAPGRADRVWRRPPDRHCARVPPVRSRIQPRDARAPRVHRRRVRRRELRVAGAAGLSG